MMIFNSVGDMGIYSSVVRKNLLKYSARVSPLLLASVLALCGTTHN